MTLKIRIRVVMSDYNLRYQVSIKRRWFWKNGRIFDTYEKASEYIAPFLGFPDTIIEKEAGV